MTFDTDSFRDTYRFADLLGGLAPRIEKRPSPLTDEERDVLYGPMRRPAPTDASPAAPDDEPEPAPRRSVVRRLARLFSTLVMVVAIGFMLLATVGPRLLPFQSFFVRSGSMRPGIPVGALVVATRTPATELHVGDIIVFDRPGHPGDMITHRIFAIEDSPSGPQFVTKGDANSVPDPWRVSVSGDGWKYKYSVPWVGFAVGYLRVALASIGARGALVIIGMVVALFAIWRNPKAIADAVPAS